MHQIQRWKNSPSAIMQLVVGLPLGMSFLIIFPWYAMMAPELSLPARLTSLIMVVSMILVLLRTIFVELVLGRALENYLLSRRTLAIVRKGKPTRFIKHGDVAQYRPHSGSFTLRNGKTLRFHLHDTPGSEREVAKKVIELWYGESAYDAVREAFHRSLFPPRWVSAILYVLLSAALAGVVVAGWIEHRAGLLSSLSVLAGISFLFIPWSIFQNNRFRWVLRGPQESHRVEATPMCALHPMATTIKRFPDVRPSSLLQSGTFLALFLLASVTIPICRYLMYLLQESRRDVPMATFALLGTLFTLYFAERFYKTLIRGELFTTVLVSTRTFAVVRPRRPVRYLKPRDIVGIRPNQKILLLADGTEIELGYNNQLGNAHGLLKYLWEHHWYFVPKAQRRGPHDLGIGWSRGVLLCTLFFSGFAFSAHGNSVGQDWMLYPGLIAFLGAPGCFFWLVFKKVTGYRVSLRPDDYPGTVGPRGSESQPDSSRQD